MYEVRLFTNKMKDFQISSTENSKSFPVKSIMVINVNVIQCLLKLESIGDESNIEDFENRRFYVQMFEMKLLGYILEDDYEVVPTIRNHVND
jgi:hypothetical protein